MRVEATRLLAEALSPQREDGSGGAASVASSVSTPSLPNLELPKFYGTVTQWPSFWDQFEAVVDKSDLPEVSKFTYLQSLLRGEAKAAIKGLSLTSQHYKIACDILQKRYGRKERIIFAHIQDLMNVKVSNASSLSALQDELLAHIRSLKTLGVDGGQYGIVLTPLILARLPEDIRLEWAREGEGREDDLKWLMDFLQWELHRREWSQTFQEKMVNYPEEKRGHVPTAASLHTKSERVTYAGSTECDLCGRAHRTEQCWCITKLSAETKQSKLGYVSGA